MRRRKLFEIHFIHDAIAKEGPADGDTLVVLSNFFDRLNAKLNEKQTGCLGILDELSRPETD